MKPYDDYTKTAVEGAPFLNGTEWECWQFSVCLGGGVDSKRCVNDDSIDDDGGCPLIRIGVCDQRTPLEWTDANGRVLYRCTEKTTPAQARAEADEQQRVDLAAMHYPLLPEVSS